MAEASTAAPAATPAPTAKGAPPPAPAKPGAPASNNGAAPPVPPKVEEATEVIKVNGKEVKVTKAQLVALAQKGAFADEKLRSVQALTNNTSQLLAKLKTPEGFVEVLHDKSLGASPKEVFRKLLASPAIDDELKEDIARWTYDNIVAKAKKTPEELERDQKLTEYERLKAEKAEREKQEAQKAQAAEVQKVYAAIRGEVTKAIVADKTFPQTEGAIRAVFDTLRAMNRKGAAITADSIGKALTKVKNDHLVHQQAMFDAVEDPEALIRLFGENRALKIAQALVKRIKAKANAKIEEGKKTGAEEGANTNVRQKVTERIDEKLGRERHGYSVLKI